MKATLTGWGRVLIFISLLLVVVKMSATARQSNSASANRAVADLLDGRFRWKVSQPLVAPVERPEDPCCSVKDLTVYHFCQRRLKPHQQRPEVRLRGLDAGLIQSAQADFGTLLP